MPVPNTFKIPTAMPAALKASGVDPAGLLRKTGPVTHALDFGQGHGHDRAVLQALADAR
jgi:hypothetical protein